MQGTNTLQELQTICKTQTPKFKSNNNNSLPNSTTAHQHTTISSTKYSPSGTHMIKFKKRYGPSHNFFPYFRFILFLFIPSSFSPSPQPSHIPFRLSSTNLTYEKKAMIDEWKWWKWWPKDEVVVARLQSSMLKMMEKMVQLCHCTYFQSCRGNRFPTIWMLLEKHERLVL